MEILHRPRLRRQRADDDAHDPLVCGLGYATDCRDCRAARDAARADDPQYRYADWTWRVRCEHGHQPTPLPQAERDAAIRHRLDVLATIHDDPAWAAAVSKLDRQILALLRRAGR